MLDLLFLPFTGPFKGLEFLARRIVEQAEQTWYDEGAIRGAMLELELLLQDGEISQQEHASAQEQLMERLAQAVSRRQGLANLKGDSFSAIQ